LVTTTNPRGEHLELDQLRGIENYNEFERPDDDQIAIETPDGDYWIISTAIRERGERIGCLDLKVSNSRLNAITGELVLLNLMLARIENFSSELARKVEEATRELALRNEELKRINQELFETQKNLARSERLAVAGQLAASLAHEIGTPLNSISGHVQLLARRKGLDDVSQRRIQIIENQIENIVRTVKQLP